MVTTTKTDDYLGRDLTTPDTDAHDYLGRGIMAGDRDYMGRSLIGGSEDPAQALLDEAAVRFDFSQYDDIDDMVDVNGGWGPVIDFTQPGGGYSFEFVDDGLQMTTDGVNPNALRRIGIDDPLTGPLTFGPTGITLVDVVRLVDDLDDTVFLSIKAAQTLQANTGSGDESGYPQGEADWTVGYDTSPSFYDMEPTEDTIVDVYEELLPPQATFVAGVYLAIYVLDVPNQELRIRLIAPATDRSFSEPFVKSVPGYAADSQAIDVAQMATTITFTGDVGVVSLVQVEWLGWNRALTAGEVDALVAHFTA